jgi:DNA polymerase-3 subunit gamma/tau
MRIADGRDIDVLEIDAATHTGIDNVREVIVSGLSIVPVANRYKVFIIDEVHQLSAAVVQRAAEVDRGAAAARDFMMATTELEKIPETVLSRSQVYEFRSNRHEGHRRPAPLIVDKEVASGDDSLQLIARDAEGSMRDGPEQARSGHCVHRKHDRRDDVAACSVLVGRDLRAR